MAAKTWEADFRYPAIQASLSALGEDYRDDPFRFPRSFCLPVGRKPIEGWTPGRFSLIAIIVGFALLVAGVFLLAIVDRVESSAFSSAIKALAVCCSLSGIFTFFVPATMDRQIISWLIGKRGRDLVDRSGWSEMMSAEVGEADVSRANLSIDGDDHVLILFDEDKQCLEMEGIGARYQIRAEDVEKVEPFQYLNYIGAEIVCRIDSETRLRIAIARVSLLFELTRQLPFLFFMRKWMSNKILENCRGTLGFEDVELLEDETLLDEGGGATEAGRD